MLRGAQEMKKMMLADIRRRLVFFLRANLRVMRELFMEEMAVVEFRD
jgi:hypothetical protein